jgi:putative transcriptional regulator
MNSPEAGIILISDPFLKDPNFMRTAVLLCEHNEQGSFGFVLNRRFDQSLNDFIPDLSGYEIPVHYGGPVEPDTIHFLHNLPHLADEAVAVLPGVYWGGDFKKVIELIQDQMLDMKNIRFFLGYSGWSAGQLDMELKENSWLTVGGSSGMVFHPEPANAWRDAVKQLDGSYHQILNYPIDPQLN